MPSAMTYIPPTSKDRGLFNAPLQKEISDRRKHYKQALEYYEGKQEYPFPDDEDKNSSDATTINLVKMTADRTASFLFNTVPKFELDPTTPDDTKEEAWIKGFFKANGGLTTLSKLALRGFLSGHCFVQVKAVPKAKRNSKVKHYPQMLILDPTSVSVYWKADDVGDILWYEKRYYVGETVYIQDFIKDGDQWIIRTFKSIQKELTWLDTVPTLHGGLWSLAFDDGLFEEAEAIAVHKSYLPPIIEWAHLPHPDNRYGIGEFTNKSLQDTINQIASARNRIVKENSEPTDVLTGADIQEVRDDGPIIAIPNVGAKVTRLEMKGDLTAISTVLKELMETYLAIARVVLLKGEAKDLQRVTNASVRTLFLDMLAKNNLLQYAYGEGLINIVLLALQMGYEAGDSEITQDPANLKVDIKWPSPLPTDMAELANVFVMLDNIGAVSKRTVATEMGYDWTFEQNAMKSEQEEDMKNQEAQMEMMSKFAPSQDETGNKPKSNLTTPKKPVE